MRPTHALTILLIFVVAALAVFVSGRYAWQADWTYANRNSLTEPSRRLLAAMPGAIAFTAYAYPGPARQRIRDAIDRYRRADDDVSLTFVDPATHPRKMRKLGVKRAGEVRLHYQGRGQTLTGLTEQQISTTLQQLSVAGHQRVVFVTGHGERDPRETGPGGYSTLKAELERQGMQVATLNLAVTPKLPGNATVLVLASPQKAFSASAVELMQKYLAAGGNLLWLGDPSNQARIPKLAALLGFAWQPGTVIY
ncbi:MAG: GldG family protein, partial [Salinisphaera sp.]|nr:GldG family protein [Salinisphaera sp.]